MNKRVICTNNPALINGVGDADTSQNFYYIDKQLQDVLTRFPQLLLALVFGSVAEGRPRPDSDLDIAVAAK